MIQGRAETILVAGIYPLGCSPLYLTVYQEDQNPKTGCIDWLNELIEYHNRLLQRELKRLRKTYPHSKILYADYYGPIMHLHLHPGAFGETKTSVVSNHLTWSLSLLVAWRDRYRRDIGRLLWRWGAVQRLSVSPMREPSLQRVQRSIKVRFLGRSASHRGSSCDSC